MPVDTAHADVAQAIVPILRVRGKKSLKFPSIIPILRPLKIRERRWRNATPLQSVVEMGQAQAPVPIKWVVAQTKSQQDRALVRELIAHKITYFIAAHPTIVNSGNREYLSQRILFPGYVFFLTSTEEDVFTVRNSRHVFDLMQVKDQIGLHRSLELLHKTLANTNEHELRPSFHQGLSKMNPGLDVQINQGSLNGQVVRVTKTNMQTGCVTVQLSIGSLGCTTMDLPCGHLSPLE